MADGDGNDNAFFFVGVLVCIGILLLASGSHKATFVHDSSGVVGTQVCSYSYSEKYTVQPGDCASGIVEKYYIRGKRVSLQKLIEVNGLVLRTDEYGNQWCDLYAGQELIIPIE